MKGPKSDSQEEIEERAKCKVTDLSFGIKKTFLEVKLLYFYQYLFHDFSHVYFFLYKSTGTPV